MKGYVRGSWGKEGGGGIAVPAALCACAVYMVMLIAGCGKKSEQAVNAGRAGAERAATMAGAKRPGTLVESRSGVAEPGAEQEVRLGGEERSAEELSAERPAASDPAAEFLPVGYGTWQEFEEKHAQFRKERAAAQEALPVNEDGSRVWLGQVVFADRSVDTQIKTFGMAKKLVKGTAECEFMKMDGTRVKFSEAGLGEAVGKLAAKKYVKVFGWLDEQAGTIKPIYIDVAGEKYVWKNRELVREQ